MIDQTTIDRIFDTAQITEVVNDFVSLKKRGVNFLGLCPFHNEKTPSFTVSPAKGIYKCFGCGKGGNSVNFIMEHEHLSYVDALKYLAKKYHIEIEEKEASAEEIEKNNERESLLIITEYARQYFSELLKNHPEGQAVGMSYFRERGFRDDSIEKFQLGYSLEKRDAFTEAAKKNGYKTDFLVKTGLTIEKENHHFDRFSGRVMFPIHGLSGKVVGFGGRILKTDKNTAKYLNSPESEIYHKSRVLYGLYHAKKAILQNDRCYLVEGYTDVLSMHQSGIENVVASSGTSLTVEQIRLIKRFTNFVTIIYDGDAAGIKASLRGIDMVLEEGLNVKVLLLPDGDDPDSFAKKHSASEFTDFIKKNETDFVLFKTQLLISDAQSDPIKKATLIADIVRSIAIIPDTITRSVYIHECASILKTDERVLYSESNKIRRSRAEQKYQTQLPKEEEIKIPQSRNEPITNDDSVNQEKELTRLIINNGNKVLYTFKEEESEEEKTITVAKYIIDEIVNDELEFSNPLFKQIFDEYRDHLKNNIEISEKYFIYHPDEEISKIAADMLSKPHDLSNLWKKNKLVIETEDMKLIHIVPETVIAFKNKKIMKALNEAQNKLNNIQQADNLDAIEEIQQQIMILNNIKKTLSKSLGDRIIL